MKKRERQSLLFGFLIFAGVALIIIAVVAFMKVSLKDYAVYKDEAAGIQIKYPADWSLYDKPEGGSHRGLCCPPRNRDGNIYAERQHCVYGFVRNTHDVKPIFKNDHTPDDQNL